MRPCIVLLLGLTSCAEVLPASQASTPAALASLLDHPDPARREEAAARLSILGSTVAEALGGKTAARTDEDTGSLRAALQQALAEPTAERMIRRAFHSLRTGCLARDAPVVAAALSAQGFRRIEIYEPHDGLKFTRYLAQPSAYVDGAGGLHDLFCWTQALRRSDSTWIVREVYVGLHARFDAPFKAIAPSGRYPRGSVLAMFLERPELLKLAQAFPVLEEIEFTYGRIRDKGSETAPAGFHVIAGFVTEGKTGGRSVYYTAECGLDPREGRGGALDWEGFSPADTVGSLTPRGSGIWGSGGLKPVQDE
ncbi:MAG TPA: hypothetical protein VKU80_13110 [Planctomycetota bacterium]|nr:hypothetical protein [Planctomycetota bacterium]